MYIYLGTWTLREATLVTVSEVVPHPEIKLQFRMLTKA